MEVHLALLGDAPLCDVVEIEDSDVPSRLFITSGTAVSEGGLDLRERFLVPLYGQPKSRQIVEGTVFTLGDFVVREGVSSSTPPIFVIEVGFWCSECICFCLSVYVVIVP